MSARDSRSKLNIDRAMLTRILTYHQVSPGFLDFLFTFGLSEHPKDFHFSGFRSEMNFDDGEERLLLPQMGRSGRELRMSYILRGVEPAPNQKAWPWAIRQSAIYHAFDIETARSVWLIVKANKVIKSRIKSLGEPLGEDSSLCPGESPMDDLQSFESSLLSHLLICDWASEQWRWYIGDIERRVQELTRDVLTESADLPAEMQRSPTFPPVSEKPEQGGPMSGAQAGAASTRSFSFEHLQEVHYVEEKANEALLVLRANASVINDLERCYSEAVELLRQSYSKSANILPEDSNLRAFRQRINVATKDSAMHQSRLEALLRLLSDRRSLVCSP